MACDVVCNNVSFLYLEAVFPLYERTGAVSGSSVKLQHNFSTCAPSWVTGVLSVYGKKVNVNTAAVFKTFYEISISASSYWASFTHLVR
jgi:hypothetical protein